MDKNKSIDGLKTRRSKVATKTVKKDTTKKKTAAVTGKTTAVTKPKTI